MPLFRDINCDRGPDYSGCMGAGFEPAFPPLGCPHRLDDPMPCWAPQHAPMTVLPRLDLSKPHTVRYAYPSVCRGVSISCSGCFHPLFPSHTLNVTLTRTAQGLLSLPAFPPVVNFGALPSTSSVFRWSFYTSRNQLPSDSSIYSLASDSAVTTVHRMRFSKINFVRFMYI